MNLSRELARVLKQVAMAGTIHVKTGSLEGIGRYQRAIFQGLFSFRKTETVADKGSCFGWAKYQGRNFCTAESIVGFQRPLKYGHFRVPKVGKNGSRPTPQIEKTQ
jgi:hypothetical protein